MILITGVSGLLGSAIAKFAAEKGEEVIGICRNKSRKSSLRILEDSIPVVECDITNRNKIRSIICSYEPEIVIHLAAQPIVSKAYSFPQETFDVNFNGTVNVLEASIDAGVKHFIFGSSDKVYGNCDRADESFKTCPEDLYAISKLAADFYVRSKADKIQVTITRPCNIYGFDVNLTRIIPHCIVSCMSGRQPEIRNPRASRQFLYAEDYARAIWTLIEQSATGIYNIGSFDILEISLVASEICEHFGIRPKLLCQQKFKEADYQSVRCTKLLDLGWHQKYMFASGIEKTIELYKKYW